MKRARDIRDQLAGLLERVEIELTSNANDLDAIKKAITSGFFPHSARLQKNGSYRTVKHSQTVHIHPTSGLVQERPLSRRSGAERSDIAMVMLSHLGLLRGWSARVVVEWSGQKVRNRAASWTDPSLSASLSDAPLVPTHVVNSDRGSSSSDAAPPVPSSDVLVSSVFFRGIATVLEMALKVKPFGPRSQFSPVFNRVADINIDEVDSRVGDVGMEKLDGEILVATTRVVEDLEGKFGEVANGKGAASMVDGIGLVEVGLVSCEDVAKRLGGEV
uniref:Pre-mRNA-splicing factor ATP-dependent RNA helicase DHX16 n=1 Tax=Cajanus cajan TaxID=3821 RepID=A0A151SLX4_CAJCA|nr:Putative pre-mRNA-splicing factor ATP-dependent RNA helicase DHX16 [Cajanus cajan]